MGLGIFQDLNPENPKKVWNKGINKGSSIIRFKKLV
jgi:hypothetical protein